MNSDKSVQEPEDSSRRTSSDRRNDDVEEYADIISENRRNPNTGKQTRDSFGRDFGRLIVS